MTQCGGLSKNGSISSSNRMLVSQLVDCGEGLGDGGGLLEGGVALGFEVPRVHARPCHCLSLFCLSVSCLSVCLLPVDHKAVLPFCVTMSAFLQACFLLGWSWTDDLKPETPPFSSVLPCLRAALTTVSLHSNRAVRKTSGISDLTSEVP